MKLILRALLVLLAVHNVFADEVSIDRQTILELGQLIASPSTVNRKTHSESSNIHSLFFNSLPYEGKATKTFAWLGIPEKKVGQEKVPGIVLVHGGGGTAFKEWVERWNNHGFAAISIAVEGQTDEKDSGAKEGHIPTGWRQHANSGPYRTGIYGDSDKPLKDQWMYHAVADTILAHSLLRSHPRIDSENVGVMGISWGGVIVSTVVGIDTRFSFGIPTYGCGNLADAANQYGKALGDNTVYRQTWDPVHYLPRATMPLLWQSWPEDKHFPLDSQSSSYKRSSGPRLVSLRPGMGHGHGPPWTHADSYAFAKSVVKTSKPWCAQKEVSKNKGIVKAAFSSSKPFESAVLVSTTDTGITGSRAWTKTQASLVNNNETWTATASLPPGTTAWFLNFKSGDLIASTDFQQVTPSKTSQPTVSPPNKNNTKERHPLFSRIDMNKDELLSREEYVLFYKKLFPSLDTNQDSFLDQDEFVHKTAMRFGDTNKDGTLTKDEYEKIFKKQHSNIDSNGNGTVSQQEWKQLGK